MRQTTLLVTTFVSHVLVYYLCLGCNVSYKSFGEETKAETFYWTGSASSSTECMAMCSSDLDCVGCGFNYEKRKCTKSNSTSVKSTSDDESRFYQKNCDPGCVLNYTYHGQYHRTSSYYNYTDVATPDQCEILCSAEIKCAGFGYNTGLSRCFKSVSNVPEQILSCDACTFASKRCRLLSYEITTSITSETMTTVSLSTSPHVLTTSQTGNTKTTFLNEEATTINEHSVPTVSPLEFTDITWAFATNTESGGNKTCEVSCICVKPVSYSIDKWTATIKKELTIAKNETSAGKRKLACAPDPRFSSYVIGMTGVLFLCFACALVVIPDLTTVVRHLSKPWSRKTSTFKRKLLFYPESKL